MTFGIRTLKQMAAATMCTAALACACQASQAEEGPPCQPQWVSMFSAPNALNGPVRALLVHDFGDGPALYVGGSFTMAGALTVNRIAKWSLTGTGGWSAVGSGFPSGAVNALAVFNDGINGPQLYAGLTYSDAAKRWTGSQWLSLTDGFLGHTESLVVYNDGAGPALYLGGDFTYEQKWQTLFRWDGRSITPTNVGEGAKGGAVSNSVVFDHGQGAEIFISGNFSVPSSTFLSTFAKGNGSTWDSLWGWGTGWVAALGVFDDGSGPSLYTGCYLFHAATPPFAGVARWTPNGFEQLGTGFGGACTLHSCEGFCNTSTPSGCWCDWMCCGFGDCCFDVNSVCGHCLGDGGSNCAVHAFAEFDDGSGAALYAAGAFDSIGDVAVNNIAKWNGTHWNAVSEGISQPSIITTSVRTLAAYQPINGDAPILFAGGNFTNTVVGDNYLVAYVGCPTRPQCAAADINCDGVVNVTDLLTAINAWGSCPAPPAKCPADIAPPPDGDGQINVLDLLIIINNWA